MAVNTTVQVTLPAMGESVREGTVLEWHKQEGDAVEADEPLVDVSTDKVDAEVPAPTSGTLVKILAAEGDTVAVGAVLAEIAPRNGAPAAPPAPQPPSADGNAGAPREEQDALVDIVTPAGGESVQEATILEWSVQVGDSVNEGDTVVELSTDKVDMELSAPVTGTIAEILAAAGDTVAVGQTIARMRPGGDGLDGRGNGASASPPVPAPPASPAPVADADADAASAPDRRPAPAADGNGAHASPVARRIAAAEGIDITALRGSGPAG
ncbi:MAG: hypothetical protein QOI64_288, partial [Solirubrobacteraceae bacterium]|nr:hypothetical protein [Solirubrobacteraceae bacterium]